MLKRGIWRLLFLAVGDFERVSRKVGDVDVGVVVKRGSTGQAGFALDAAEQLLPWFNDYFGTPYPLPKLDLVAVPGGASAFSAMENWGAILYFEKAVLVDDRVSSAADRQNAYTTIGHEMAHQCFGDDVSVRQWADIWLNEGFATWLASRPLGQGRGERADDDDSDRPAPVPAGLVRLPDAFIDPRPPAARRNGAP